VTHDEMSQHFDEMYEDRLRHEHLPCYDMTNTTEEDTTMQSPTKMRTLMHKHDMTPLDEAIATLAALDAAWEQTCNDIQKVNRRNAPLTEREAAHRAELKASRRFFWAMRVLPTEAVLRYTESR
jgi:hypothetical protein